MKEKILEVKNLEVSFKTYAGISHAVRGIDFNLHHPGHHFQGHPDAHQEHPRQAQQPPHPIGGHRDALDHPDPQVGEVPKDQGHRQLQQLDRVVPPAQD